MTRQPQQPLRDILTEFPATDYAGLIVRYPEAGNGRLAHCFADAAERLAATFRGGAADDSLLMPVLDLYRHAIELDLKHAIRYAAHLRSNNGELKPELSPDPVDDRLQNKHRHRLMALVDELDGHLKALDQPTVPRKVRVLITRIAASDPVGEAFRYGSGATGKPGPDRLPSSSSSPEGGLRHLRRRVGRTVRVRVVPARPAGRAEKLRGRIRRRDAGRVPGLVGQTAVRARDEGARRLRPQEALSPHDVPGSSRCSRRSVRPQGRLPST